MPHLTTICQLAPGCSTMYWSPWRGPSSIWQSSQSDVHLQKSAANRSDNYVLRCAYILLCIKSGINGTLSVFWPLSLIYIWMFLWSFFEVIWKISVCFLVTLWRTLSTFVTVRCSCVCVRACVICSARFYIKARRKIAVFLFNVSGI